MTTQGFVATHAKDSHFERGLRAFFEYGGKGHARLEVGSCVHQPPGIRHRELGRSDDVEMLEFVLPADFATEKVGSIDG